MKSPASLLVLLLLSPALWAAEADLYVLADSDFKASRETTHEISNMPPIKDQNGAGLCYSFSAATVAEQYICKLNNCGRYSEDDLVSPISLAGFSSNSAAIEDGGNPGLILAELAKGPALRKEKCAPFPPLAKLLRQSGGWDALQAKFSNYKVNQGCTTCLESEIRKYFPAHIEQLSTALQQSSFEAFLWEIFVPASCKSSQVIRMPPVIDKSHPVTGNSPKDRQRAMARIEQLLLSDIPVLTTVCIERKGQVCAEGHATVVSGIREVCNANGDCRLQLKVHNSYGLGWQMQNQNGWVQADQYLEAIESLHWLERPGQTYSEKKLARSSHPDFEVAPERTVRKSILSKPGENIRDFTLNCYRLGGTPAFTDSGRRCDFR
ncbi:MAG: hypothetical protein A2X94_11405 [Bdellovibrionales bacterium GWB1_55_8]|nr:MAG: hypothetical protein A2X94_11405 [Bdellovibrionales bacterium GWB1_55_8]